MEPDFAPLWLPGDENTVGDQSMVGPPDRVDGWSWPALLMVWIFGSRSRTPARAGAVVALVAFVFILPALARRSLFDLPWIMAWQSGMIGLLLLATRRVRTVSLPTVMAFWLAGMFTSVLIAELVEGLIGLIPSVAATTGDWHRPIVAEAAKVLPIVAAAAIGGRNWRHPGLSDLVVIGFAVGSGFAFHEDALWNHALAAGFNPAGHAVWSALIAFSIGLIIFYRHDEMALLGAVAVVLVVIGDQTILDLGWLPALFLLVAAAIAGVLDRGRLKAVGERDHLFPDPGAQPLDLLAGRYRRLRNGVHTSISRTGEVWPPLRGAPVGELARAARAADVKTGAESSRLGWDRDPDDRTGENMRFFGPNGWTPFVIEGTQAAESTPRSRPEATTRHVSGILEHGRREWRAESRHLWIAGAVVVLVVTSILSASTDALGAPILTSAEESPALVRTIIGALGATAAIFGRPPPDMVEGWELGPPEGR